MHYLSVFVKSLLTGIVKTPLFPHWLDRVTQRKALQDGIRYFTGSVLETGAGNGMNKQFITSQSRSITSYIATDYTSWDDEFNKHNKRISALGKLTEAIYGAKRISTNVDKIENATSLSFHKSSFDTYCSFNVIEHIEHPVKLISEAYRVLKPGGYCVIGAPYLFREHGGIEMDFQRLSRGGYYSLAKQSGFTITKIITYSYFGTTMSHLINSYLIRKIAESTVYIKPLFLMIGLFVFPLVNCVGFCIDTMDHDVRFSTHYLVVMKKPKPKRRRK